MSTHPLEAIVSALERRQFNLEVHVEELADDMTDTIKLLTDTINHLSDDMTASFQQLVEYHIRTEGQIDTRFNQVDARFNKIENDIADIRATMATKEDIIDIRATMATKEDIIDIRATMATKEDIVDIRATMATKEDITTTNERLNRLETTFNERLNRLETAFGTHTTLLTQILERLPG